MPQKRVRKAKVSSAKIFYDGGIKWCPRLAGNFYNFYALKFRENEIFKPSDYTAIWLSSKFGKNYFPNNILISMGFSLSFDYKMYAEILKNKHIFFVCQTGKNWDGKV